MHPILDSWSGTEHEWLRTLLFAFNAGDIGKFESLAGHFSKLVRTALDESNSTEWY
jgi:26S proteasome regulatory subunit N9